MKGSTFMLKSLIAKWTNKVTINFIQDYDPEHILYMEYQNVKDARESLLTYLQK